MDVLSLASLRVAAGFAAAAMLGGGINDSTSNHSHMTLTYVFWYGVAGVFVALVVGLTVVIERRKRGPRPKLTITIGSGIDLHQPTALGDFPSGLLETAKSRGFGQALNRVRTVLLVTETNGVAARGVRARIREIDGGPGRQSELEWQGRGHPEEVDISAEGRASLIIHEMFDFQGAQPGGIGHIAKLPRIDGWQASASVAFEIELFDAAGILGCGRFRMTARSGNLSEDDEPTLAELAAVDAPGKAQAELASLRRTTERQEAEKRVNENLSVEQYRSGGGPIETSIMTKEEQRRRVSVGERLVAVRFSPGAYGPTFEPVVVDRAPSEFDVGNGGRIRVQAFTGDGLILDEQDTFGQSIVLECYPPNTQPGA